MVQYLGITNVIIRDMAYTTNPNIEKVRVQAIRMVQSGKSTREVARHFGYAQSTIVKWCKRKDEIWHQQRLPTRSSRPHRSPKSLPRNIVAAIITKRDETKRCAEVVHEYLKRDGIKVSLSSVKRVLKRHGMTKRRSPWKKTRKYPPRPDIHVPGDLVQFDTIHFVDKHNKRSYVYTAIDIYSRMAYAMVSKKSNTHSTIRFLKKVKKYFDFDIKIVQTDNGPEFGKFFTDFVERQGLKHRHIPPRSPNHNGHLERFNRTIQEEMPKQYLSIRRQKSVEEYLIHYNTKRLHMGIQMKTPSQMLED